MDISSWFGLYLYLKSYLLTQSSFLEAVVVVLLVITEDEQTKSSFESFRCVVYECGWYALHVFLYSNLPSRLIAAWKYNYASFPLLRWASVQRWELIFYFQRRTFKKNSSKEQLSTTQHNTRHLNLHFKNMLIIPKEQHSHMIHEFEVLSLPVVTSGIYFLYDFISFLHRSLQDWLS